MEKTANEEFEKFKATQGVVLFDIYTNHIEDIEKNYGREVAIGYTLGMDTAHMAITGLSFKDVFDLLNSNADSVE